MQRLEKSIYQEIQLGRVRAKGLHVRGGVSERVVDWRPSVSFVLEQRVIFTEVFDPQRVQPCGNDCTLQGPVENILSQRGRRSVHLRLETVPPNLQRSQKVCLAQTCLR